MHVGFIFLFGALLVGKGACDCDKYIECFGDFLRDFFGNVHFGNSDSSNTTNKLNKTISYEFHGTEDPNIDKVLSEITNLIKEIDVDIKESEIISHNQNKTKIVVKTFELDEDFLTTESSDIEINSTTTETTLTDDISFSDLTASTPGESMTTDASFYVIPLESKNEKDNEIDIGDHQTYSDDEEAKFVTDYPDIDYIEIYKDTTNEVVNYEPTEVNLYTELNDLRSEIDKQEKEIENLITQSIHMAKEEALAEVANNVTRHNTQSSGAKDPILKEVSPWIAAIYVKNETGSQFDYFCDGALLSESAVLTAARCVNNGNGSFPTENFIVILGKTSLLVSGSNEKILRVKEIKTHQNFTIEGGAAVNDLAILILEEPVVLNDAISTTNVTCEDHDGASDTNTNVTTAWGLSGDIALIYFDKGKSKACDSNNKVENTFCATYGDDVPLCPSYGGLFVTKQAETLYLAGIRTGDPTDRGICFSKQVTYTSLKNHTEWIFENIEA